QKIAACGSSYRGRDEFSDVTFTAQNQGIGRSNSLQHRWHGLFAPRTLCEKRRHTYQFEPANE
ncbi:MAG: hypothetical protein ACRESJ_26060, partial [Pseudomonas sp.]|uniref:hypothetical protein n=1 Tax=Pseudomonas sp. TaxID=306 RepID=UPI003D6E7F41